MMSTLRSKSLFLALALLVAGAVILSGCAPSAPASIIAAAAAVPSVGSGAQGINTVGAAPAQQPAQPGVDTARSITVVGQGEVKVKPTVATSNIGIEVTAPTVADAMKDARAQMDSVLKALKGAGVADKDIQTSNFSINFERQGPVPVPAKGATTGAEGSTGGVYHVNNMVNVTIRDLDKVGAVLDAATNAGANNVWGISFGIEDTKSLEADARQKAVDDAKARAQELAQLNGVALGKVIAVSEVIGQTGPRPVTDKAMGMGGGGTPVEPGEVTVTTQIQVVYAIQ